MNRFWRVNRAVTIVSAAAMSLALAGSASAQETFKLGIVTFLSGPAADSFGVPARNGAQFVIDQLNKGSAPSPYEKVGFGGMEIVNRYADRVVAFYQGRILADGEPADVLRDQEVRRYVTGGVR